METTADNASQDGRGEEVPLGDMPPPVLTGSAGAVLPILAALSSASIPYRVRQEGDEWLVDTPPEMVSRAEHEIAAYRSANRDWPPQPLDASSSSLPPTLVIASMVCTFSLFGFYRWSGSGGNTQSGPAALGILDAAAVRDGQWWRPVTALTLHGSLDHLLGNVACCFCYGLALGHQVGTGMGWFLIVAAGVIGNALAASLQVPPYRALGASTAAFGALGVLSAYQCARRWGWCGSQAARGTSWVPLAAGGALLAFLGTSPGSDTAAHVLGFAAGLGLGSASIRWLRNRPGPLWQTVAWTATAAIVVAAWQWALRAG